MKLRIKDIMVFEPVATKLLNYEWKTPQKSYNVFKIVNSVLEQKKFFMIEKSKLFQKYGETQGESIIIKKGNEDIFQKSIDELLDMEIEIPEIEFTLDDVLEVGYIQSENVGEKHEKLTPLDMYRIETFLNVSKKEEIQDDCDSKTEVIGYIPAEE